MEPGSYIATAIVPGRTLIERPSRRVCRALGAALRRLHEQQLGGAGWLVLSEGDARGTHASWLKHLEHESEWSFGFFKDPNLVSTDELGVIERTLRGLPLLVDGPAQSLLHGDLQVGHVFGSEDGRLTGLIDWSDVQVGDPAWDIAVLSSWTPQVVPFVLDGYEAEDSFRARFAEVWAPYRLLRHLWGYRTGVEVGWDESERLPIIRELLEVLR